MSTATRGCVVSHVGKQGGREGGRDIHGQGLAPSPSFHLRSYFLPLTPSCTSSSFMLFRLPNKAVWVGDRPSNPIKNQGRGDLRPLPRPPSLPPPLPVFSGNNLLRTGGSLGVRILLQRKGGSKDEDCGVADRGFAIVNGIQSFASLRSRLKYRKE